jgi:hypothetical protein
MKIDINDKLEEKIGEAINKHMKEQGLKPRDIAEKVYKAFGYEKPNSAGERIRCITRGMIYGSPSMLTRTEENLRKLALVLKAMNIKETDPVIEMIKEYDSRFDYS